jgi:hypothetical protein
LTDGIDVVVVVPEDLADRIFGELSGIVRDGTAAVEVEDLQAGGSADGEQFAGMFL